LSTVAGAAVCSCVDSFSVTSAARCIWRMRTIIRATSGCFGVQPTKVADGPAGLALVVVVGAAGWAAAAGSPRAEASADCSQLPAGMIRETSRMRRSQSKRVPATPATDCSRVCAICAKSE
jgi:hypothetical protein